VPYLIEALYLRTVRTVEVPEEETQTVVRGALGETPCQGLFGGYHQPVMGVTFHEMTLRTEEVFISSHHSLAALKQITGKNFEFLKSDWYQWWVKEGKAQLLPKPKPAPVPAPAPAPEAPK
jgi:hypothetical protein